jgi:hypothetical protein
MDTHIVPVKPKKHHILDDHNTNHIHDHPTAHNKDLNAHNGQTSHINEENKHDDLQTVQTVQTVPSVQSPKEWVANPRSIRNSVQEYSDESKYYNISIQSRAGISNSCDSFVMWIMTIAEFSEDGLALYVFFSNFSSTPYETSVLYAIVVSFTILGALISCIWINYQL